VSIIESRLEEANRLEVENARLRETNADLLATVQGFLHHVNVIMPGGRSCNCDLCLKARDLVSRKPLEVQR
jgi:hypothetical protein